MPQRPNTRLPRNGNNPPSLRTVVLRGFNAATRCITIHTDRRSPKIHEIRQTPNVALHVYAPAAAIQLRLEATAAIHIEDEVTNKAWARTPPMSRVVYAMNPPPGTPVSEPPPNPESIDHTATNFAVLRLTFDRLEWLWLSHEGHRRAAFTWDNAANPHATWLAP